jgi:hypothetical protein
MGDSDLGIKALQAISADFAAFMAERGRASEADTRVKVVDRILTEVLQVA